MKLEEDVKTPLRVTVIHTPSQRQPASVCSKGVFLRKYTESMDMSLSKLRGTGKGREAWSAAVGGVTKSRTRTATIATGQALPEF